MKREPLETGDKSKTLLIPEWNETYHSHHGALTEALHVFILHGLKHSNKTTVRIFEMGFGTGLNALLSLEYAHKNNLQVFYDSIEKYPLSYEEVKPLSYPELAELNHLEKEFEEMHLAGWNETKKISDNFVLKKLHADISEPDLEPDFYDIIYYDAFGPRVQPELWSEEICRRLFQSLRPGGILVTYCAQGQFKRNLKSAGFEVENLEGPPGKREMTRALKVMS